MRHSKDQYPDNWNEISKQIKQEARWKCQECNLQFLVEENVTTDPNGKKQTYTVIHLDLNPQNNDRENLKAVCGACHCRLVSKENKHRRIAAQNKDQIFLKI